MFLIVIITKIIKEAIKRLSLDKEEGDKCMIMNQVKVV